MSESSKVSDCCGAEINDLRGPNALFLWGLRVGLVCSKCHKPCRPVDKEGEDD